MPSVTSMDVVRFPDPNRSPLRAVSEYTLLKKDEWWVCSARNGRTIAAHWVIPEQLESFVHIIDQ